jgi:hypothetical protein
MTKQARTVTVLTVIAVAVALVGCSSDSGRGLRVGMDMPQGGASGHGGSGGVDNPSGGTAGGLDISDNALEVEIQHEALAVELVTLRCAGDCAEVEAVARGGHAPYAFVWDDGGTEAVRMLCPDATTTFGVAVTDTAIDTEENPYEARTERAEVTAEVLDCTDDAGMPPLESDCGPDATAPLLLVARRESATTNVFVDENGNLPDYIASLYGTQAPLAIVASATSEIHLGSCTKLLLAADAAGTQNVGWDDTLIVEYRSATGTAIEKRWLYGTVSPVTYGPTGEQLTSLIAPTIAGWDLDPPVPNPLPFGYPPLAIDLMSATPSDAKDFELTVHVLDASSFGSTTDIWLIPRP